MNILITGCSGFIGSNLLDVLLANGNNRIVGLDNLSTGRLEFISKNLSNPSFSFHQVDLLNFEQILPFFEDIELVFHFSANADVRFGLQSPQKDLEQNTIVTSNVLEAMRVNRVNKIAFSSTGSVYGEASIIPTPEYVSFPIQTSLYGASKVASEALIQAYCEGFDFQSWIFRFVSILGERYTHGHIFDFYRSLKSDKSRLPVLGNGRQVKSYLYVQDCIDAMLLAIRKSSLKVNTFNLGTDSSCQVIDSIGWICKELGVEPVLEFSGGDRGWIGDNPIIQLDTSKIKSLGWMPKLTIQEGVIKTVQYLMENEWVFDDRPSVL